MLKNDNRILKNNNNIFKALVVDSYLTNNNPNNNTIYIGVSGLTTYNPLNVYYKTPSKTIKQTRTTDSTNWYTFFPATSETSNKPYYFSGNLDGVYKLDFRNHNSYDYRGGLVDFINEFPFLQIFEMDYDSNFNENITNANFPSTLKWLELRDTSLNGDIATITGVKNLEHLKLYYGNYSGSFSDLGLTKLQYLNLYNLYSIVGDVTTIMNNNPDLYYWYVWSCGQMTGNVTTMDISNITYMNWYAAGNNNIIGSMSGWTFNTGMTYFSVYPRMFGGDITNLDISDTKITTFTLTNYNYYQNVISGDLSGWILPNTLTSFSLYGISGMTAIPQDYSNTNLNYLNFQYCWGLSDNINDINFTGLKGTLNIDRTEMTGNLENFNSLTGVTSLRLRNSNFTGNLSGITLYSGLTQVYLDGNLITGNVEDVIFHDALYYFDVSNNTSITLNLDAGVFSTNKLSYLYLDYLSGITGNWSNFNIPITLTYLYLNYTPIIGDISVLDISKISQFFANGCSLACDISNWFTGETNITRFDIYSNYELSGDTTNWDVDDIRILRIQNTKLSGVLKHNNVYQLYMDNTNISSNIVTDFNFNNLYYFRGNDTDMVGHLSGVTLGYNFYYFSIYYNSLIYGTNEFIDYLFVNRENWTRNGSYVKIYNIGDTASGTTETLGDLGTYGGDEWDLEEAEVNNLVVGIDYDGNGSNTPWNNKEKMYWQKNAEISSTNSTKRYKLYNITYT